MVAKTVVLRQPYNRQIGNSLISSPKGMDVGGLIERHPPISDLIFKDSMLLENANVWRSGAPTARIQDCSNRFMFNEEAQKTLTGVAKSKLRRVLVVDDEIINRELLCRMLQRHGYQAESASDGIEALALTKQFAFDLVLLDVNMPGMDGFECLRHLRERFSVSELPIIMVTADLDREKMVQAFRAGANDYVTKPLDREITLARIATHTQLRASLLALRDSEERYALAARGSNDGLWDWDVLNNQVYYSPRWKSMLGYQEHEIDSSVDEWLKRIHQDDRHVFQEALFGAAGENEANFHCEIRMVHRDGAYRWMICRGVNVRDANGTVYRMAGSLTDITEGKVGDALTGLPNRLLFMDRLEHAIERFQRHRNLHFAVMFLDLDNFKLINDSLGHQAGDEFLMTIAKRLSNCLRQTDSVVRVDSGFTLARHAGDEFTILLEDLSSPEDAERVATRILREISEPLQIENQQLQPSASIGWTVCGDGNLDPDDLLREADTAMYQAKSTGRNRAVRFDPSMQHRATLRLELENRLRQAVANREFLLHYQPLISIRNNEVIGFESLVRWQHPQRGVVFPGEFITTAEEMGLIIPLGWQIAEMACAQAALWQAQLPQLPFQITINFSIKQFYQKEFLVSFQEIVRKTGVRADCLCIEVTESMLMEKPEVIRPILFEIKKMGVQIAIDDFGTGYSSLAYLHRFPLDTLKIDRSFVKEVLASQENHQIVRTIVELGKTLGMKVVAEGIETADQRERLLDMGCEFAQGYFWSPPVPAAQAFQMLRASSLPSMTSLAARSLDPATHSLDAFTASH